MRWWQLSGKGRRTNLFHRVDIWTLGKHGNWFKDVFVYRQAYHPMSWIQPGASANFQVLIRTSLIIGLYMAGEQRIELVPLRSVLPRHILTFLPPPRSLNCKPCCWSNHPLWWVVCSSHSRNCTMKCWMVVGFQPFEPKSFRLPNLSFKVSGLILKAITWTGHVDTCSSKSFFKFKMTFYDFSLWLFMYLDNDFTWSCIVKVLAANPANARCLGLSLLNVVPQCQHENSAKLKCLYIHPRFNLEAKNCTL